MRAVSTPLAARDARIAEAMRDAHNPRGANFSSGGIFVWLFHVGFEPLGSTTRCPVAIGLDAALLLRGGPEAFHAEGFIVRRGNANDEQFPWGYLWETLVDEVLSRSHFFVGPDNQIKVSSYYHCAHNDAI